MLYVPHNFHGYIILVYGVDKKPKLQTNNLLSPNIDITVPESGIIFTSNKLRKSIVIIDSSHGKIKTLDNVPLTITLNEDDIHISGEFLAYASDFDIKIPKIVKKHSKNAI